MAEHDSYLMEGADCYSQAMQAMQGTEEQKLELAIVSELGLKPTLHGNKYIILWGEDITTGIAGCGSSVSEAVTDFNANFYKKICGVGLSHSRRSNFYRPRD